ncbi:uncharacterized protein [Gossypium hirsutum]|uniref:VOC domain-containing protein n=1 Tax=Gossypium hirsutum TaxID=3635 RepID=A0ABM3A940_GOSHI|nr:uncharacterized protein LOC107887694 [Gossypium hirsutum]
MKRVLMVRLKGIEEKLDIYTFDFLSRLEKDLRSELDERFLGISIPFPLHRLAIHCLKNPILPLPNSHHKNTQSAAISRTLRLRYSSSSSKVRVCSLHLSLIHRKKQWLSLEEVQYLDVLTKIDYGVVGIHHVGILCENLERSLEFCQNILGLEINEARPHDKLPYRGAWLWVGSEMIHLMEFPNPEPLIGRSEHGGRDFHACISIRDVSKLQAILNKAGVYLKGYNAILKKEIPVLSFSPCHFKLVANDKAIGNGLEMFDGHKTHRSQNSLPISGSGTSKWTSQYI